MSLVKLTQDLKNFKWTKYDSIGSSQTPQSFDVNGITVTGNKLFNRPSKKALDTMESVFGVVDKGRGRGPYRIVDFMDGTSRGRGFVVGSYPAGFISDIPFRHTNFILSGELKPTPLSHTVSRVNHTPEFTIDEQFGYSHTNK